MSSLAVKEAAPQLDWYDCVNSAAEIHQETEILCVHLVCSSPEAAELSLLSL